MKNLSRGILIAITYIFFLTYLTSCKKERENNTSKPNDTISKIEGNIILSDSLNIDLEKLVVHSSIDENNVKSGLYEINVQGYYSTQFVSNDKNQVLLLGYTYPNGNFDITVKSTALALAMNTPSAMFLTNEGKKQMVENILVDQNLPILEKAIERLISEDLSILDTSSLELLPELDALFKSVVKKKTAKSIPVNLFQGGRFLTFSTKNTFNSVVGVYQDGQKLSQFTIQGVNIFPTSLGQLYTSIVDPTVDIDQIDYEMIGDGQFEFRIRTGKPGFNDGSMESNEAFFSNITDFSFDALSYLFPDVSKGCQAELRKEIRKSLKQAKGFNTNSNVNYNIRVAMDFVYDKANFLLTHCPDAIPLKGEWLKKMKFLFKKLDAAASLGTSFNEAWFAAQWSLSSPEVDTCFYATGNSVGICDDCGTTVTDIDGNIYPVVKIGGQCWMAENLRTTRYNDSSIIPQIISHNGWDAVSTGAYCYYNNNSNTKKFFGKLYNHYAVRTEKLCPKGWHIPSDSEYQTLIDELGGESIAGQKLKSTEQGTWQLSIPWISNTNSSGFSAVAGGHRDNNGFDGILQHAFYHTSSNFHTLLIGFSNNGAVIRGNGIPIEGYSCRCLKD